MRCHPESGSWWTGRGLSLPLGAFGSEDFVLHPSRSLQRKQEPDQSSSSSISIL